MAFKGCMSREPKPKRMTRRQPMDSLPRKAPGHMKLRPGADGEFDLTEGQLKVLDRGVRAGAASVRVPPQDRDDVVQDAWLRALAGLSGVRPHDALGAWGYCVGRRAGLSRVRRQVRCPAHRPLVEGRTPGAIPAPTDPFRRRQIIEALSTLPPRRRPTSRPHAPGTPSRCTGRRAAR